MLIAIEGADLVGKSTLAENIRLAAGGEVRHAGPPTEHPLMAYEASLRDYVPRSGWDVPHVILDRFHLGEHVWPSIFGRESELDVPVARHVELFLRSRGLWLVYAKRDTVQLMNDVARADPPEPIEPQAVPAVLALFEQALAFAGDRYSTWDYEEMGAIALQRIIQNAINRASDVLRPWSFTSEWIGNPEPVVLFVGDEFGPAREKNEAAVPFTPWRNTSGHYLMGALPEELWRDCAIVNAHQGRDDHWTNLHDVWQAMGRPSTVALGKTADKALDREDVPHASVPHPQWWRRFNHHAQDEYTETIRRAARSAPTAVT